MLKNSENQGRLFDGNREAPFENLTGQESTNNIDCQKIVNKNISSKKMQENYEGREKLILPTVMQILNVINRDK